MEFITYRKLRTCRDKLDRGDIPGVIARLQSLPPKLRIDVLLNTSNWWGNTILTDIIRLINKAQYNKPESRGENHPIRLILHDANIDAECRAELLLTVDLCNKTPLHEACAHNDTETVQIIIEAVADPPQRADLLSKQDSEWGYTPLHKAARWAREDTLVYLMNCLSPEQIVKIMKLKSFKLDETPLHASMWNYRDDTACLAIVQLLLSTYDAAKTG